MGSWNRHNMFLSPYLTGKYFEQAHKMFRKILGLRSSQSRRSIQLSNCYQQFLGLSLLERDYKTFQIQCKKLRNQNLCQGFFLWWFQERCRRVIHQRCCWKQGTHLFLNLLSRFPPYQYLWEIIHLLLV